MTAKNIFEDSVAMSAIQCLRDRGYTSAQVRNLMRMQEIEAARAAVAKGNGEESGPRKNPPHPMFRDHNCAFCSSGEKPCRQNNPSQCEFPHARND